MFPPTNTISFRHFWTHFKLFLEDSQVADLDQIRSDDDTVGPDNPLVTFRKVRPPSFHLPSASPLILLPHSLTPLQLFEQAGDITGCTFSISETMGPMIAAAGFENLVEKAIKTPIGGWA
jgi:hypothetical protein